MTTQEFRERFETLTRRQQEVVRMRCEGLQNKEIANRIFRSEQTVKNHITSAYHKLQAISSGGGGSQSAGVCYQLGVYDERRGLC